MELCKKWIEKHKISEARSSLFYVLLMNVHGIGSANHKSALLLFPHYPRVGKASWSRLNSPRGLPPPPRAPRPSPRPRPPPPSPPPRLGCCWPSSPSGLGSLGSLGARRSPSSPSRRSLYGGRPSPSPRPRPPRPRPSPRPRPPRPRSPPPRPPWSAKVKLMSSFFWRVDLWR